MDKLLKNRRETECAREMCLQFTYNLCVTIFFNKKMITIKLDIPMIVALIYNGFCLINTFWPTFEITISRLQTSSRQISCIVAWFERLILAFFIVGYKRLGYTTLITTFISTLRQRLLVELFLNWMKVIGRRLSLVLTTLQQTPKKLH